MLASIAVRRFLSSYSGFLHLVLLIQRQGSSARCLQHCHSSLLVAAWHRGVSYLLASCSRPARKPSCRQSGLAVKATIKAKRDDISTYDVQAMVFQSCKVLRGLGGEL